MVATLFPRCMTEEEGKTLQYWIDAIVVKPSGNTGKRRRIWSREVNVTAHCLQQICGLGICDCPGCPVAVIATPTQISSLTLRCLGERSMQVCITKTMLAQLQRWGE